MDLLVHAKDFHAETSDQEIPAFWDEYFSNEATKKIPGYLGVCAQGSGPGDSSAADYVCEICLPVKKKE